MSRIRELQSETKSGLLGMSLTLPSLKIVGMVGEQVGGVDVAHLLGEVDAIFRQTGFPTTLVTVDPKSYQGMVPETQGADWVMVPVGPTVEDDQETLKQHLDLAATYKGAEFLLYWASEAQPDTSSYRLLREIHPGAAIAPTLQLSSKTWASQIARLIASHQMHRYVALYTNWALRHDRTIEEVRHEMAQAVITVVAAAPLLWGLLDTAARERIIDIPGIEIISGPDGELEELRRRS